MGFCVQEAGIHAHLHINGVSLSQHWAYCQKLSCCLQELLDSQTMIRLTLTRHKSDTCIVRGGNNFLTSSHLMNFPPFFSASWTDTGLSCNAWTPGLAPAMARDSLPGCQRLNPGYGEQDSSEGTKNFHPGVPFPFPGSA